VEKAGEVVAQVKGTVLLMPNGSDVVSKSPAPQALSTDKKVEDADILELLAQPIKKQKKKVGGLWVHMMCVSFSSCRHGAGQPGHGFADESTMQHTFLCTVICLTDSAPQ
jgi:hypothetical protein